MIVTQYKSEFKKVNEIDVDFDMNYDDSINFHKYFTRVSLELITDFSKEHLIVLYLSSDLNIIAAELISIGTTSMVSFEVKEIVRGCINFKSNKVVIIHNHPFSSMAALSIQDKEVHKKIKKDLLIYEIDLFDSLVIIDSGEYASGNTTLYNSVNLSKNNAVGYTNPYHAKISKEEVIPKNILVKKSTRLLISIMFYSALMMLNYLFSLSLIISNIYLIIPVFIFQMFILNIFSDNVNPKINTLISLTSKLFKRGNKNC